MIDRKKALGVVKKIDKELWGIWAGDDTGYYCYWAFGTSRKEAIGNLERLWPKYPWKKAYKDGCRAVRVTVSERKKP